MLFCCKSLGRQLSVQSLSEPVWRKKFQGMEYFVPGDGTVCSTPWNKYCVGISI